MPDYAITAGRYTFGARLERELAPNTCAAFERHLPFKSRIIHVRWSGEGVWMPLGDLDFGVGFENNTCYPAAGQLILYPGGGERNRNPARLRLRQLRLQGRPTLRQPLHDTDQRAREPLRVRPRGAVRGRQGNLDHQHLTEVFRTRRNPQVPSSTSAANVRVSSAIAARQAAPVRSTGLWPYNPKLTLAHSDFDAEGAGWEKFFNSLLLAFTAASIGTAMTLIAGYPHRLRSRS